MPFYVPVGAPHEYTKIPLNAPPTRLLGVFYCPNLALYTHNYPLLTVKMVKNCQAPYQYSSR